MEAGSTSRMQTALRVLSTHCKLGETATPEDVEKVRSWAGDETLSPADAAAVIVWRELEERRDGSMLSRLRQARAAAANGRKAQVVLAGRTRLAVCSLRV